MQVFLRGVTKYPVFVFFSRIFRCLRHVVDFLSFFSIASSRKVPFEGFLGMVTKYPIFFHRRFGHVDRPCPITVSRRVADVSWARRVHGVEMRHGSVSAAGSCVGCCCERGWVVVVWMFFAMECRRFRFRDDRLWFYPVCESTSFRFYFCGRDDRDRSRSTDDAYRACFWSKLD